ncbi:MAG: WYL domain-containing protein [Armatimonadetes bacterium]|nr:MAG: WYL domain-containing protein [Armatimonadota bacterium]
MQRVIERILNLLAFLLTVGRPVTADEIRNTVAGYEQETDEAFRRTFERDKDLLRSLGVPLTMSAIDIWEVEDGYVIPPDEYAIDDPGLTEEERSALLIAAQAVQFAGQSTGLSAIFKLGGASPVLNAPNVAADLGHDLDVLGLLFDSVSSRRVLAFDYSGTSRRATPYAIAHRLGHWYLAAPEVGDPETVKAFRVDRMTNPTLVGEPSAFSRPDGFDPADVIPSGDRETENASLAIVEFDNEVAQIAANQVPDAEVVSRTDSTTTLRIPVRAEQSFIGWVLGFDDKAVIIEPQGLRDRLIAHLSVVA